MRIYGLALCSLFASLLMTGCKTYRKMNDVTWSEIASSNECSVTISSLSDAAKLALVGNPELNLLRLNVSGSEKIVKASGWWEDPQFGFDLMRIINPSRHPFLGGGVLGFTVPLFGTKTIETDIAAAKTNSIYERIKARECEVAVEARKLAIDCYYLLKSLAIIERYGKDASVTRAEDKAFALYKAGECPITEVNSIYRRKHEREHLSMALRERKISVETQFRKLAGLSPECAVRFALEMKTPPSPRKMQPEPEKLVSHPIVKAELSLLNVAEHEFKLQIRKQYPELSVGPQFGNEEGADRIGFNMGVTLPVWNRNRLSIAQAGLEREKHRYSALEIWRSLAVQQHADVIAYQNHSCHGPVAKADVESVEKLFSAGELSVAAYLGEREEILRQSISEIEWQNDLAVKRDALRKYDLTIFE